MLDRNLFKKVAHMLAIGLNDRQKLAMALKEARRRLNCCRSFRKFALAASQQAIADPKKARKEAESWGKSLADWEEKILQRQAVISNLMQASPRTCHRKRSAAKLAITNG